MNETSSFATADYASYPRQGANDATGVSVIIPVSERYDSTAALYDAYKAGVAAAGIRYEFIYIIDGDYPEVVQALTALQARGEPIRIIRFTQWFGEATALTAGFQLSTMPIILTLPAYCQVEPDEIPKLLTALSDQDMVVARRWPRCDAAVNRIQTRLFNAISSSITGSYFRDLGCGVRAFKRQIVEVVPVYGDQHRFLPVLARRWGFRVKELEVAQSRHDTASRIYKPGVYLRRLLDVFTVFFLVKFTKKPLRFFGLIGSAISLAGGLVVATMVVQRAFFGLGLADRPLLLLASLLVVLGVQIFGLGLIGELIIFTHAKDIKEYTIEEIIN